MIVDASITGERLTHARNPQDFFGYVIKEGSFWAFMYFAGPMISKALEKHADKKGKSIDLDARVIFNDKLKESFKNGTLILSGNLLSSRYKILEVLRLLKMTKTHHFIIENAVKQSTMLSLRDFTMEL